MLMADDPMRNNLNKDELKFLVRAWNAAFAKAKELYWISISLAAQSLKKKKPQR